MALNELNSRGFPRDYVKNCVEKETWRSIFLAIKRDESILKRGKKPDGRSK